MTTYTYGGSLTGTSGGGNYTGIKITIGSSNMTITNITKHSSDQGTTCYIRDSSMNAVTSASYSGDSATFSQSLSANTTYYFLSGQASGNYAYEVVTGNYPYSVNGGDASIITGRIVAGDTSDQWASIYSFTYSIVQDYTGTPSALTLSTTLPTPTILFVVAPSAFSMSLTLQTATLRLSEPYFAPSVTVGTGGRGTKIISKKYPHTDGLTIGTTKIEDNKINLKAQEVLLPQNQKVE